MISANLSEVRSWLNIVYGDMPGHINICSTANWEGRCFTADQIEDAVSYIDTLDKQQVQGIYARVTSLKQAPAEGRGSEGESLNLPGLWADLDIAGPGHKTSKPLPETVEQAMNIITVSGLPEPTVWIHSGGGLYPWWLLAESVSITDLESMKILSSNWQTIIEHASKQLGYSYGTGVKDLARVLRIPGTINRKIADSPRPCEVMYDQSSGRQYTLADLEQAMLAALPAIPTPEPRRSLKTLLASGTAGSNRPGDDFNARADWRDILSDWEWVRQQGGVWYLRRPGKSEGISATIGHSTDGVDRLYVFSDATEFEQNRPYDKYGAYVLLEHGGDFRAATRQLSAQGFGTPLTQVSQDIPYPTSKASAMDAPVTADGQWPAAETAFAVCEGMEPEPRFTGWTHVDAGRFADKIYRDMFHLVHEEKQWRTYQNGQWKPDRTHQVPRAITDATDRIRTQAYRELERAEAMYAQDASDGNKKDLKSAERNVTSAKGFGARNGILGILGCYSDLKGVARSIEDFDVQRDLVCLDNGTLNLRTRNLLPHDPKHLLTRRAGKVSYDPDAKAPMFDKYIAEVVPDEEQRRYLQRMAGYSLLGTPDECAFVILQGAPGCGKSQFINILNALGGEYAKTAAAITFRASNSEATNNLHDLRGARIVTTSETERGSTLDGELIKRVTGDDPVTTRALYQENMTWTPEFTLFMAVNDIPSIRSDDDGIWKRVKIVRFPRVFRDMPGQIRKISDVIIENELPGVLNWALEGLKDYLTNGMQEPASVTKDVKSERDENDPVIQFLAESVEDSQLVKGEEQEVRSSILYSRYTTWCKNTGERSILGSRRFGKRLDSLGFGTRRGTGGQQMRTGIGVHANAWMGSQPPGFI